ncbi:MAG: DsbC family protein [Gammaproteobacteria bacterium]|nr:DsbC family protein [Gammaproteobacteria bacterium]
MLVRIARSAISLLFVMPCVQAEQLASQEVTARIRDVVTLNNLAPNAAPSDIRVTTSAIPALYTVAIGTDIIYATEDGTKVVTGQVLDLANRRNLTEDAQQAAVGAIVKTLGDTEFITFPATSPAIGTVTVWMDVDCHYCQQLHKDLRAYNAQGITVRYAAFPRAGLQSESANKMRAAWCARDKVAAINAAIQGRAANHSVACPTVEKLYDVGNRIGVTGTPTFVTQEGRVIVGLVAPDDLAHALSNGAR